MHVIQGGGIPHKFADSQDHAKHRDARLQDALRRTSNMQAFIDVLVNFTTDAVTSDQIDVALSDAQAIVRRLKSAKDHADCV